MGHSSDSSDSEKGHGLFGRVRKHKNKRDSASPPPQQQYYSSHHSSSHQHQQQHQNSSSQHPLGYLCDPTGTTIILTISNTSDTADELLTPQNISAYTIGYQTDDYNGQVRRQGRTVGSWKVHSWHTEKLEFFFAWTTKAWGFTPEEQGWSSDVGFLGGHELQWTQLGSYRTPFTLKCVDVEDSRKRDACVVTMDTYDQGRIEIPLRIVGSQDQLDELVTVAVATMDRIRDGDAEEPDRHRRH